jgi:hypothetical protein
MRQRRLNSPAHTTAQDIRRRSRALCHSSVLGSAWEAGLGRLARTARAATLINISSPPSRVSWERASLCFGWATLVRSRLCRSSMPARPRPTTARPRPTTASFPFAMGMKLSNRTMIRIGWMRGSRRGFGRRSQRPRVRLASVHISGQRLRPRSRQSLASRRLWAGSSEREKTGDHRL